MNQAARSLSESGLVEDEVSNRVASYMNSLPMKVFSDLIEKNVSAAIASAIDREHDLRIIRKLICQPQPFYGPSRANRTRRVFAHGVSIQSLSNQTKKVLTDGWVTYDLQNSQLAILSTLWDITELRLWLTSPDNSAWDELTSYTNYSKSHSVQRRTIKEAIYSIAYGASLSTTKRIISSKKFFSHWIVQSLLDHRERQKKLIETNGGLLDRVTHEWMPLCRDSNWKDLLARHAQSIELALVFPVIELAEQQLSRRTFVVSLWEHDGFSVRFYRDQEKWHKRIVSVVDLKCLEENVPTRLVMKS